MELRVPADQAASEAELRGGICQRIRGDPLRRALSEKVARQKQRWIAREYYVWRKQAIFEKANKSIRSKTITLKFKWLLLGAANKEASGLKGRW